MKVGALNALNLMFHSSGRKITTKVGGGGSRLLLKEKDWVFQVTSKKKRKWKENSKKKIKFCWLKEGGCVERIV